MNRDRRELVVMLLFVVVSLTMLAAVVWLAFR